MGSSLGPEAHLVQTAGAMCSRRQDAPAFGSRGAWTDFSARVRGPILFREAELPTPQIQVVVGHVPLPCTSGRSHGNGEQGCSHCVETSPLKARFPMSSAFCCDMPTCSPARECSGFISSDMKTRLDLPSGSHTWFGLDALRESHCVPPGWAAQPSC